MYLCGVGDPLLWGTTAFLLNFIPILGPLFGTVIFLLAGMLSFDGLWWALLPAAVGPVARLVGIECGVVSGVFNLEIIQR